VLEMKGEIHKFLQDCISPLYNKFIYKDWLAFLKYLIYLINPADQLHS
jgi:hypothetical protein